MYFSIIAKIARFNSDAEVMNWGYLFILKGILINLTARVRKTTCDFFKIYQMPLRFFSLINLFESLYPGVVSTINNLRTHHTSLLDVYLNVVDFYFTRQV